jgi:hypothetical protein
LLAHALTQRVLAQAALLRRAAYVYRMPTQEQRARVGLAWLQRGAQSALDALRAAAPPAPPPAL